MTLFIFSLINRASARRAIPIPTVKIACGNLVKKARPQNSPTRNKDLFWIKKYSANRLNMIASGSVNTNPENIRKIPVKLKRIELAIATRLLNNVDAIA